MAKKQQPALTINIEHHPSDAVIVLIGALDVTTIAAARREFDRLVNARQDRIILDVSMLDGCDHTGLVLLLEIHHVCFAAGGWLRLIAPNRALYAFLDQADLLDVLCAYPNVKAAREGWLHERIFPTAGLVGGDRPRARRCN